MIHQYVQSVPDWGFDWLQTNVWAHYRKQNEQTYHPDISISFFFRFVYEKRN